MKRALVLLLTIALAVPVHVGADERTEKKRLVAELLEIIDTKALTQASFDLVFNRFGEMAANEVMAELGEEEKAAAQEQMKAQQEQVRVFRDRLFTRIDYNRYAEEIYAPLFDKNFTADELRELIAFYKTKPGQKHARMLPDLALDALMKGMQLVQEEAQKVGQEMTEEENRKHPWKGTMADMRMIATAVEALAIDEEKYPTVTSIDALEPLLEPTYIRDLPKSDGWGNKFAFVSDGKSYRIASAGSDKQFEWNAKQIENIPVEGYETRYVESDDADIIYENGTFVQAPKKSQQEND